MKQENTVDINTVLAEYKGEVAYLLNDNIMLRAYTKQLEKKIKELEKIAEADKEAE